MPSKRPANPAAEERLLARHLRWFAALKAHLEQPGQCMPCDNPALRSHQQLLVQALQKFFANLMVRAAPRSPPPRPAGASELLCVCALSRAVSRRPARRMATA